MPCARSTHQHVSSVSLPLESQDSLDQQNVAEATRGLAASTVALLEIKGPCWSSQLGEKEGPRGESQAA